jgi:DNA-binding GntR family transcriptional regulator
MTAGEYVGSRPSRLRATAPDPYRSLPEMSGGGTIADRIYSVVSEAIIEGQLPPGMHLKADELSRRYGVSMIPVREALRTLQATGWVTSRAHHGAFVRRGTEEELTDLFETRSILEPAAGRLAAERRTAGDLVALTELVNRGFALAKSEADSARQFSHLNDEFHRCVAEATHNRTVYDFQQQLNQRVRFYSSILTPERIKRSVEEHARLVEAIRDEDPFKAGEISLQHIGSSRRNVADNLPRGD